MQAHEAIKRESTKEFLTRFFEANTPQTINNDLMELLATAIGSPESQTFEPHELANMVDLCSALMQIIHSLHEDLQSELHSNFTQKEQSDLIEKN